jgi:hypothetical protein
MFGLFKRTAAGIPVVDKVWMSKTAKLKACADMLGVNPDCLFIAWFKETFAELQAALHLPIDNSNLRVAENITPPDVVNRMIIFAEHHPLHAVEQELFRKLNLKEVPVLCSLDEHFFSRFGGEKTIELMRKLGMKEDEVIGHSMITKSIRSAQDKISKHTKTNYAASSQAEWFTLNLPSHD